VALQPGVNNITVKAFDGRSNQSSKVLAVTLADVVAPTVSISPLDRGFSTTSNTVRSRALRPTSAVSRR
jgi:hypothetical protein